MRPALFQLSQSRFNSVLSPSPLYTQSSCLYERTYPILFSMFFLLRRIVSYLWESVKVPFRPVRSDVETVQSLQIDSLRVYPS